MKKKDLAGIEARLSTAIMSHDLFRERFSGGFSIRFRSGKGKKTAESTTRFLRETDLTTGAVQEFSATAEITVYLKGIGSMGELLNVLADEATELVGKGEEFRAEVLKLLKEAAL